MVGKKLNWCFKLKEGLKIAEPNERLSKSYIEQTKSSLLRAEKDFEDKDLLWSTVAIYYAEYYALYSFLQRIGIKCENHSASIILLKELFSIDNSGIFFAKEERVDKQYYTDFNITKQEILEAIRIAENFNKRLLDFISKLDNQKIKEYREKFKILNWKK